MLSQVAMDRFLRSEISKQYDLVAYEKLILFFLASYMGSNSNCYPSFGSLAIDCSVSIDSIKRCIKSLEKKGLIRVSRIAGRSNHYSFNLLNIILPSADTTQCPQHLGATSTTYPVLTAPGVGAHSTPNNINNNIKEYTSLNICEVKTSFVDVSENDSFADMKEIFRYWQETMNHSRAKLDKKRKSAIEKALKLGYPIDDLKKAIDGCAMTPFNMGKNNNGQVFDDISLILRDAEHIERFMSNAVSKETRSSGIASNKLMAGVV